MHNHWPCSDIRSKQKLAWIFCKAATSISVIAKLLREQGIFSGSVAVSITDAWLARFDDHLVHVHGMSRYSRDNYVRYARRLIQSLQTNELDWSTLDASHISEFVRREAAKLKPGSCRQPVTAVRAILRFLVGEGLVPADLHRAVPVIRYGDTHRYPSICRLKNWRECWRSAVHPQNGVYGTVASFS